MRAVSLPQNIPTSWMRSVLAAFVLTTGAAAPLLSQTFHGQVVDSVNAEPISGLQVILLDAQQDTVAVTRSGSDGKFALTVPDGEYTLCTRCIGHQPKRVTVRVPSDTLVVVRVAQLNVPTHGL